jgi:hypothetical protein
MNLDGKGLSPGTSQSGFILESDDLPGFATFQIRGDRSTTTWIGHVPPLNTPVGKEVAELEGRNFVPYLGVVPKISVSVPYQGAIALDNLRTHITQDIVRLKLIESAQAAQLDHSLQAAADAIRLNKMKAAREHLQEAMKLLKKHHPRCDEEDQGDFDDEAEGDKKSKASKVLIDRLAARVIAFDIRYIEKRLNDEEKPKKPSNS